MSLFHAQQGISPAQILNLVGSILAPLTPSIPIPPPQRWGRLIREALIRAFAPQAHPWLSAIDRVALNPQPLPPRYLFLKSVAQEAVSYAELLEEFANAAASGGERRGGVIAGEYLNEFTDDFCGNGFRLGWPYPGPPPQWFPVELNGVDLLVLGSQFAQGAGVAFDPGVREALQAAATKLAEVGVSKMQGQ